jgi:RimJ/RimL family protein N-acetyltransferase
MAPAVMRLGEADAAAFRDIRLEGLRLHPEAFGASLEEEIDRPVEWFAGRIAGGAVFAAKAADGELLGVAGFQRPVTAKLRHKGVLWGMYVREAARGTGVAAAVVGAVLDHAGAEVEEVLLTVAADNAAALRLYRRAGFVQYGLERRSLKVGDVYYDEIMMACPVGG